MEPETIGDIRQKNCWLELSCITCTAVIQLHKNMLPNELPNNLNIGDASSYFNCEQCSRRNQHSEMTCKAVNPLIQS